MLALATSAEAFRAAIADLQALCGNLKKYESAFSADAKALFQSTNASAEAALAELESLPEADDSSIAGYLTIGNKAMALRAVLQSVQQATSNFTSGAIPVPRSQKEELSRVHGNIVNVKFALSSEQQLLITQLRKLVTELEAQKQDFDVIETNLDNTMRNLLQQVHGKEKLDDEALAAEAERLQSGIVEARTSGPRQLESMLTLALNSLQRLHASQTLAGGAAEASDSEDEEGPVAGGAGGGGGDDEEDDDDDPFFMPMPGAIKWAEASKFKELAKPLAPEQPADKQFMIVMEDEEPARTPTSVAAAAGEPSAASTSTTTPPPDLQQLSLEDKDAPVASAAAAISAGGAAAATEAAAEGQAAAASLPSPKERVVEHEAAQSLIVPPGPDAEPGAAGAEEEALTPEAKAASPAAAAGAPAAAAAAGAAAPTEGPPPEKLTDFVNFLNGENPGACMFHAQMRLSPEGCMKLANFLRSSARVRALSLSHNYLGDAGLRLICDGLRENKSVTALDLPDNNITDLGIVFLAESIKDNPSLTQLQLAYNKIGDQGAMALAQVIRHSNSLKKLGLAFNNIGKAGCQALTAAISANQSLKHMQLLPGNPVEEKDAKALAKALKRNNKFSIKQLLGLKSDN
ncbi:hypothetical protein HXX76_007037 [Chlamydomonas incerta]|uniref:Flagellar associated protein n=1 Tax=Chlamydomonas incerta TaxID=51695 RepID=A0A835T2J0_CHLIN|nr:hypothetical protein HXX76_007037 [Chlamydomonas incerta]|eukprot:KAG2435842.1 hypothetical protein HXX76_007037 [Chlamydomonas incerta]